MANWYLAGPMRGYDLFNFPAFDNAATYLRQLGHDVFNPADHDRSLHGDDFTPENADEKGFDLRGALKADLSWIAENADGVAVLDGWEQSSGANAEVALAHALGLPVARWQDVMPHYMASLVRAGRAIPSPLTATPVEPPSHPADDIIRDELGGDPAEYPEWEKDLLVPAGAPGMSGEVRSVSSTGGEKGTKPQRWDLLPMYPLGVVAEHYARGAAKYAAHNWRRGYEWSNSFAALMRHAAAFWDGEDIDDGPGGLGTPHMAAVAFHAFTLLQFMRDYPEYDDRFGTVELREVTA